MSEPISLDISAMRKQRKSMRVLVSFLLCRPRLMVFALQILGGKELPSLSEVFIRFCQATLSHAYSSLVEHSALAAFVGLYHQMGLGLAEVAVVAVIPHGVAVLMAMVDVILVVVDRIEGSNLKSIGNK